jgi:peptidyl-prolyl cis-trans isomerase SurA
MTLVRNGSLSFLLSARVAVVALTLVVADSLRAQAKTQADGLDLRFANGIAAIVESKVITVEDIRREIAPLVPEVQRESRNEQEFNQKLEALQDEIIQNLIDRELIVKEFRKDEKRQIPVQYIDNAMADEIAERFEGDRSKFLAYLRAKGQTIRDYRKEIEENIIFSYMQGQQRKSQSVVSPVRIETYYNENKDRFYREDEVHLRLIQITRTESETDTTLLEQGRAIVARQKGGEKFEGGSSGSPSSPSGIVIDEARGDGGGLAPFGWRRIARR